jgi:hypothetical protein
LSFDFFKGKYNDLEEKCKECEKMNKILVESGNAKSNQNSNEPSNWKGFFFFDHFFSIYIYNILLFFRKI